MLGEYFKRERGNSNKKKEIPRYVCVFLFFIPFQPTQSANGKKPFHLYRCRLRLRFNSSFEISERVRISAIPRIPTKNFAYSFLSILTRIQFQQSFLEDRKERDSCCPHENFYLDQPKSSFVYATSRPAYYHSYLRMILTTNGKMMVDLISLGDMQISL